VPPSLGSTPFLADKQKSVMSSTPRQQTRSGILARRKFSTRVNENASAQTPRRAQDERATGTGRYLPRSIPDAMQKRNSR
jgi:hypothetical protein